MWAGGEKAGEFSRMGRTLARGHWQSRERRLKSLNVSEFVSFVKVAHDHVSCGDVQYVDLRRPCGIRSVNPSRTNKPVKIRKKLPNEGRGIREGPPLRVYAHVAPLDGDHTTALSGTLWRHTLRLMLARADSVKVDHSSDYVTGCKARP